MSIKLTHRVETEDGIQTKDDYIIRDDIRGVWIFTKPELIELKNLIDEELKK